MRKTGSIGEKIAIRHLKKCGYKIIERNYRLKCGEIDIIAKDGECTCFIEVKMRTSNSFAEPFESIDYRKQEKLHRVAKIWLNLHRLDDSICRFDVVSLLLDKDYRVNEFKLIKGAFWTNEDISYGTK